MADDNKYKSFHRWAVVIGIIMLLGYSYIIGRYVVLLANDRDKYLNVIEENEIKTVERRGHRGNIYDCRGRLVSATLPEYILYIDLTIPHIHQNGKDSFPARLEKLCYQLSARFHEETPEQLRKRLMFSYRRNDPKKHDNGVRLLKKRLSYDEYQEVRQMSLMNLAPSRGGRVVVERQNRENLFGEMARRVIGAVYGIDDTTHTTLGRFGIEQSFDSELSGTKGLYLRQRVGGAPLLKPIVHAIDGCDVVLTLDMDMQDVCECAVRDKLIASGAESACMILMEVETGEIKSVVNLEQPQPGTIVQGTNMAFAMNNQPGSTFKTVSLMAAMEHDDDIDTSTMILVNGGHGVFGGVPVNDAHTSPEKYLSLAAVLARSSNVGMAQLLFDTYHNNRAGWREFSDDIAELGFDHHIDIEINGSVDPIIHRYGDYEGWSLTTMSAMSRGYEVQTTPLYTLNFYNAIANDGYYVKPHLVSALRRGGEFVEEFDIVKSRSRMCSRNTIRQIRSMLEGVVSRPDGTANRFASSNLFPVAGKTGTAQHKKVDGQWKYQISFVGYFPADNPKYSAIVVFMCPENAYTGLYCGGVFRQVAETVWSMDQAR